MPFSPAVDQEGRKQQEGRKPAVGSIGISEEESNPKAEPAQQAPTSSTWGFCRSWSPSMMPPQPKTAGPSSGSFRNALARSPCREAANLPLSQQAGEVKVVAARQEQQMMWLQNPEAQIVGESLCVTEPDAHPHMDRLSLHQFQPRDLPPPSGGSTSSCFQASPSFAAADLDISGAAKRRLAPDCFGAISGQQTPTGGVEPGIKNHIKLQKAPNWTAEDSRNLPVAGEKHR